MCGTHLLSMVEQQPGLNPKFYISQQPKLLKVRSETTTVGRYFAEMLCVSYQPPSLAGLIFTPGPIVDATVQDLMY